MSQSHPINEPVVLSTMEQVSQDLVFTKISNAHGPLTKTFTVNVDDEDGAPVCTTSANLFQGVAETVACRDLPAFAEQLKQVDHNQAFTYGVTGFEKVSVVTKAKLPGAHGAVARDRDHFHYRSAPGILMLDHDAGYLPNRYDDGDALRCAVLKALPVFFMVPMLWMASASTFVFNQRTGKWVKGPGGARIYLPVADVSDVPRALRALREYLWAAEIGTFSVSRSGQLLERTLFDLGTAQPERLDFVAGANCVAPLIQKRPDPILYEAEGIGGFDPISLIEFVPEPDGATREAAIKNRELAKRSVESERQRVRAIYRTERVDELIQSGAGEKDAFETVNQALDRDHLYAGFVLHPECGPPITVGEVLDDPDTWHGKRFADPLEPEYGNDPRIAHLNLRSGGQPFIYSHAHGGKRYQLFRQPSILQVSGGDMPRIADACIELLSTQGQVFDGPSDGMLRVGSDGRLYAVTPQWLQDHLGRIVRFERYDRRSKDYVAIDTPPPVTNAIMAREGQRGLPVLQAVVTAPTMRKDGTVIDVPGYDGASGILFVSESPDVIHVPSMPTLDEVTSALQVLWYPISLFPYDGPVSRAVALTAMLTAPVRRGLPTAPAFAIDAPTAGTGKTLLAQCIAFMAGSPGETTPLPGVEEERRKLIFAQLRSGAPCITFDNISGVLSGEAFDQAMTAPMYSSRVLSESRTETVANRALVLLTGNNFRTGGDTNRRVLRCRIDAQVERPYSRSFDFHPAQFVADHRPKLVAAALTILRGCMLAGRRRGSLASFEDWDGLVRQAVLWLVKVQRELELADPVGTIDAAVDSDTSGDSRTELIQAWYDLYGDQPRTAASAIRDADETESDAFSADERSQSGSVDAHLPYCGNDADKIKRTAFRAALLNAVRGGRQVKGEISGRELGEWLSASTGVIGAGKRFEKAGVNRNKLTLWQVRSIANAHDSEKVPGLPVHAGAIQT